VFSFLEVVCLAEDSLGVVAIVNRSQKVDKRVMQSDRSAINCQFDYGK
jgi:hypothetical protein